MLTTRIDLRMTAEFLSRIFLRQIRAQRDTNVQTIRNSTEVPAKPRNHRIEEKTNCQTMVSVHSAYSESVRRRRVRGGTGSARPVRPDAGPKRRVVDRSTSRSQNDVNLHDFPLHDVASSGPSA